MKKISYVPWLGTPLNGIIFDSKENWESRLQKMLLEDNIKFDTYNVISLFDADGCVFFDNIFYKNLNFIWELYNKKILHKSVYIDFEPPSGHCKNHTKAGLKRLSNIFGSVITYNDDVIDNKKIFKGIITNFSTIKKYKNNYKKRKLVCLIANNTSNNTIISLLNGCNNSSYFNKHNVKKSSQSNYILRDRICDYFLNYHPFDFDLYGSLWPKKYDRILKGTIDRAKKSDILSKYNFAFALDSFKNQKGYISEKIFDIFYSGCVPIYSGADNINQYIPKKCFIDIRDFKTFDELFIFISSMSEIKYNSYIKSINKFLNSKKFVSNFSQTTIASKIYKLLTNNNSHFSYEKAYRELMYFQKKKNIIDSKQAIQFYMSQYLRNGKQIEICFEYNDYLKKENVEFDVYINNKLVEKECYDVLELDYSNDYTFKINVLHSKKIDNIFVKYKCKNNEKKLMFFDINPLMSKKYGLYIKNKHKCLSYVDFYNNSFIKKVFILLKYDFKRIIETLIMKILDIMWHIKIRIKHSRISHIFTIIIKVIILPFKLLISIALVFKGKKCNE